MNQGEERNEREEMIRHLEKATKTQQEIARASYCLERAILRIAEGMTDPKLQALRETLLNAIEFARTKLPEVPEDLPRALLPQVQGRELKSPSVQINASASCVQFCFQDDVNPVFWLSMVLPVWLLQQQLAQVELLRQLDLGDRPKRG